MRLHLRLDLFDEFGYVTRNGVIIMGRKVGLTVCTIIDHGNVMLFDRLQDGKSDFSSLCLFRFVF